FCLYFFFFFSSRRRHTRFSRDWSSDVCSSDLISIPYQEFTTHFGVDSSFSVKLSDSETELPYQLEKRGNSTPENVLIWVPIDAKIGRASCRERVKISVAGVTLKRKKA